MIKALTRWLTALTLGCTLGCTLTAAALAAPVTQAFSLRPDFGPPGLATVSGSFSWDDAQSPTLRGTEKLFDLTGFSLELDGKAYALADLDDAFAVFEGNGFIGLQVTIDGVLTLSPAHGGQGAFFAFSGTRGEAMGGLRFAQVGAVGEPGASSLLLLALAAAAMARRRR